MYSRATKQPQAPAKSMSLLSGIAWFGFKLTFGLASLASVWVHAVLKNGALWAWDTAEEKRELAAAQEKHWSLVDGIPLPGYRHAFFTTCTGARLHYVMNTDAETATGTSQSLGIFIHGFPDSFLLWRHILTTPELQRSHILIAVDLPGYGGSDSLPSYGPYEMLEMMTEFILDMRKQYLQRGQQVVIVSHDWGALLCARLASEASQLAEHWVITSGMIPHLAAANAASQWSLARQMFRTWRRSPSNVRLLKAALNALGPVFSQFRCSFYIFCFHLPWPFSSFFATFGNYWFLRILHSLGKGTPQKDEKLVRRLNPKEVGEAMATSAGPSITQVKEAAKGSSVLRYGESVRKRVGDRGMSQKIRIYRDGLFTGTWEKSLAATAALYSIGETGSTSSAPLLGSVPEGSLKAPTTFMLGERDPAFDRQLVLSNMKDYLVSGSQVVLVKDAGHWLPLEPSGRRALIKTVAWALNKKATKHQEKVSTPFAAMSEVRVVVET